MPSTPTLLRSAGLFSLLSIAFLAPTHATPYTGIVAFGDSVTDMGNRWVHSDKPDLKWRPTWVVMLGAPDKLAIADMKPSGITSYQGGTNYAVGGAGTDYTANLTRDRNRNEHLTTQISGRYLNPRFNTDGIQPHALHIIRIGGNDIMAAMISPAQLASGWDRLDEVGVGVARSVETQIHALALAGVRHVMWSNLSDMAKVPSVVSRVNLVGGERAAFVLDALHKATLAHNAELDAAIARLEEAHPGLRIIKLDVYSLFEDMAADPEKYGLDSVTVGANDSRHLFSSDGLHPTPKGQRLLAEHAWQVLSDVGATTIAATP